MSANAVSSDAKVAALLELAEELRRRSYEWVCPSLETEALVNGRFVNRYAHNLSDLFGWNRVASLDTVGRLLPAGLVQELEEVGVLQIIDGDSVRSRVRFSSFANTLIAQTAWPSRRDPAVAGPEMHRFGAFVERELNHPDLRMLTSSRHLTLVGLSGGICAAAILAARTLTAIAPACATRVVFVDSDQRALRFAEVNARIAELPAFECISSDGLAAVSEPAMLVLANPLARSVSQHGAPQEDDVFGSCVALRMLDECLAHLPPGGAMLMCALAPVVRGTDMLRRSLDAHVTRAHAPQPAVLRYQVLETDAFGPALSHPSYGAVERLMQVGISVKMRITDTDKAPTGEADLPLKGSLQGALTP